MSARLLLRRNFAALWLAGFLSLLGSWALVTALPFFIYERTGSATQTGAMFLANFLPAMVLGSFAGAFVDRWNYKRTMISADLLRAALLLALVVTPPRSLVMMVYVVAFLEATISLFFAPAAGAIVPIIVNRGDLTAANSLNEIGGNLARLAAPALGGAALGFLGLSGVVALDILSYCVSALLLSLMSLPGIEVGRVARLSESPISHGAQNRGSVWRAWLAGLSLIGNRPIVFGLFIAMAMATLSEGIITVMIVPFVKDVVGGGALVFGWLMSARGLGGLGGAFLIGAASRRFSANQLAPLGLFSSGVILLLMIHFPSVASAIILTGLVGVPAVAFLVGARSLLQTETEEGFRGRVFGSYATINSVAAIGGMGIGSGLVSPLGIVRALDVAGFLYLAAGLTALWVLSTGFRQRIARMAGPEVSKEQRSTILNGDTSEHQAEPEAGG